MAWQLLAMWLIVLVTVTWFVRDERRRRADAALADAARYYAHAPKYRHATAATPAAEPPRSARRTLSAVDRRFLQELAASRPRPAAP